MNNVNDGFNKYKKIYNIVIEQIIKHQKTLKNLYIKIVLNKFNLISI
jgi:hypothetical protein